MSDKKDVSGERGHEEITELRFGDVILYYRNPEEKNPEKIGRAVFVAMTPTDVITYVPFIDKEDNSLLLHRISRGIKPQDIISVAERWQPEKVFAELEKGSEEYELTDTYRKILPKLREASLKPAYKIKGNF